MIFDKIIEWVYLNYGLEIARKHIWMMGILMVSVMLLILSLLLNSGGKNAPPPIKPNIPSSNSVK